MEGWTWCERKAERSFDCGFASARMTGVGLGCGSARGPLPSAALRETAADTPKTPGGGGKGMVRIRPGMRYGFLILETSSGRCAATFPVRGEGGAAGRCV